MLRTTLTDSQWHIITPHCLGRECDPGRTGPDPRLFVEAVLWIARTGCPGRDLPEDFGKWNEVFKRFRRWVKADAFYCMFRVSAECSIPDVCIDERRLPLFIAWAALRDLIAGLQARATGGAAR